MHVVRCMLNFDKRHKWPLSPSVNHLVVTLGLAFVFGLSFRLGLGLLFMSPCGDELGGHFMTFIIGIKFLSEVMVKFSPIGMHLIECIASYAPIKSKLQHPREFDYFLCPVNRELNE